MTSLRQRLILHARVQDGAIYSYEITDGDKRVGTKSVYLNKKTRPWKETTTYFLGDVEFATAAELIAAHERQKEQQRRDHEWEAAKPRPASPGSAGTNA